MDFKPGNLNYRRLALLFGLLAVFLITALTLDLIMEGPTKEAKEEVAAPPPEDHRKVEKEEDPEPPVEETEEEITENDAPPTLLPEVELTGILWNGEIRGNIKPEITEIELPKDKNYAVFEVKGKIIKAEVNDIVWSDWRLKEINKDSVIMESDKEIIELLLGK